MRTYTAYSIGVAIAWGVVLVLVAVIAPASKLHVFLTVFAGFAIGWLSATVARVVYPPPKRFTDGRRTP